MSDKIKFWIETILKEVATSNKNEFRSLLDKTGENCCKIHGLIDKALEIRNSVEDKNDISTLIKSFNKKIFPSYEIKFDGKEILMDYKFGNCVCPIVTTGISTNPELCNCTKGFTKALFTALLDRKVQVELIETVLTGGKSCKQRITIL